MDLNSCPFCCLSDLVGPSIERFIAALFHGYLARP